MLHATLHQSIQDKRSVSAEERPLPNSSASPHLGRYLSWQRSDHSQKAQDSPTESGKQRLTRIQKRHSSMAVQLLTIAHVLLPDLKTTPTLQIPQQAPWQPLLIHCHTHILGLRQKGSSPDVVQRTIADTHIEEKNKAHLHVPGLFQFRSPGSPRENWNHNTLSRLSRALQNC